MKKINFYVSEIAFLCFLAGCSSAPPDAEKQNTVNYLNSIRTQTVNAESGSFIINTEWNIGGEIETVGLRLIFLIGALNCIIKKLFMIRLQILL